MVGVEGEETHHKSIAVTTKRDEYGSGCCAGSGGELRHTFSREMKLKGCSKPQTTIFCATHSHINGYSLSRRQLGNMLRAFICFSHL